MRALLDTLPTRDSGPMKRGTHWIAWLDMTPDLPPSKRPALLKHKVRARNLIRIGSSRRFCRPIWGDYAIGWCRRQRGFSVFASHIWIVLKSLKLSSCLASKSRIARCWIRPSGRVAGAGPKGSPGTDGAQCLRGFASTLQPRPPTVLLSCGTHSVVRGSPDSAQNSTVRSPLHLPQSKEETCGREECGVGRPAHNRRHVFVPPHRL